MFEQLGPDHYISYRFNLDSRVLSYLTCRSRGWAEENPKENSSYSLLCRVILIYPMKVNWRDC